jgi:hypothetical protein
MRIQRAKSSFSCFRFLCKQIVRDAHCEFATPVQLTNHFVIIRVILKSAARINATGDPQTVQFAHKLARRIYLIFQRQLGAFGECRV